MDNHSAKTASLLAGVRHLALDMDGTIYKGQTLFPTTVAFLRLLNQMDIGYTFLTNNPSKSVGDYLAHLKRMGIEASEDQLYTSTQATIEYLQRELPQAKRIFALGTESMLQQFAEAGFTLLPDSPSAEPEAVVVGFDLGLTYSRLCRAAWWIKMGKPFVATNPDKVCPTDQPTVLVDCGAICASLVAATGKTPLAVLGKPDPSMISGILRRHHLRAAELAMVGDRIYTDMAMARRAGAVGVLVLTGEATAQDAAAAKSGPDVVVRDLQELGVQLQASRQHILA